MRRPKVSVVVVSFNTKEKLRHCLSCIDADHEIIVVDNASTDGSPEMVAAEFPRAHLVRNETNRGFGAANNQGLDLASGDLVLLLNSDAYAKPGAIDRLASEFSDESVVAVGGRLLNPDGSLQQSCCNELTLWAVFCEQLWLEKLFPRSRLFSPYWISHRFHQTHEVAQVMGACLMMRRLARFDERFFLYVEDTDLCFRLRRLGRILYVPDAEFTHELGSSSSGMRWLSVARYNRGKELFFALHHGRWAAFWCWVLDRKGAFWRAVIWSVVSIVTLGKFRHRAAGFWRVFIGPRLGPDNDRA